jgi:hypothetical protein
MDALSLGGTILFGVIDGVLSGMTFYAGDTTDYQDNTSRVTKSIVVGYLHAAMVVGASIGFGLAGTAICGPLCGFVAGGLAGGLAGMAADWLLTPDHVNGALSAASQVADTAGSVVANAGNAFSGLASSVGGLFGL